MNATTHRNRSKFFILAIAIYAICTGYAARADEGLTGLLGGAATLADEPEKADSPPSPAPAKTKEPDAKVSPTSVGDGTNGSLSQEAAKQIADLDEKARQLQAEFDSLFLPEDQTEPEPSLNLVERIARQQEIRKEMAALRKDRAASLIGDRTPDGADAFSVDDTDHANARIFREQAKFFDSEDSVTIEVDSIRRDAESKPGFNAAEFDKSIEERRTEIRAEHARKAEQFRDLAREAERMEFLSNLEATKLLPQGTKFELTVSAEAQMQTTNLIKPEQSPVSVTYLPATITWTMRSHQWAGMYPILNGPANVNALMIRARKALETRSEGQTNTAREIFYRDAIALLQQMKAVAESTLYVRLDESAPIKTKFKGTTNVEWSTTVPSNLPDTPPTRIAAQLKARPFELDDPKGEWSTATYAPELVIVQSTDGAIRDVLRNRPDLVKVAFRTSDDDMRFLQELGELHQKMQDILRNMSANESRNVAAIGQSGGFYAIGVNPNAFAWMPLYWDATVTTSGGGLNAPRIISTFAKGSAYSVQTVAESALGQNGIGDLIANVKPAYTFLEHQGLVLDLPTEQTMKNNMSKPHLSSGAYQITNNVTDAEDAEFCGDWLGAAHGRAEFSTAGNSKELSWEHKYTMNWELRPVS